jgi:hypothetical protein
VTAVTNCSAMVPEGYHRSPWLRYCSTVTVGRTSMILA